VVVLPPPSPRGRSARRRRYGLMVLLSTLAPGVARAERAAEGGWRVQHLLEREPIQMLATDPNEPANVWAASRDGVWRSVDRGVTWRRAGLDGWDVKCLAVSPHDPRTVVAGVKPAGVVLTEDGGDSWDELRGFRAVRRFWWWSPADPPGIAPYVSAVAISPDDPTVMLAGVELGAVVRSEDGGRTWSPHLRSADRDCHDLRFHAVDGSWVYEAGGGGPAVSRDAGRTWQHPLRGLQGRYTMACAAAPSRPELWYVSASPMVDWSAPWRVPVAHYDGHAQAGIYRAAGGAAWERLGGGLPQPLDHMPYALVTDPQASGDLYAGLANGEVWHGQEYGDVWTRLPVELGGVRRSMVIA